MFFGMPHAIHSFCVCFLGGIMRVTHSVFVFLGCLMPCDSLIMLLYWFFRRPHAVRSISYLAKAIWKLFFEEASCDSLVFSLCHSYLKVNLSRAHHAIFQGCLQRIPLFALILSLTDRPLLKDVRSVSLWLPSPYLGAMFWIDTCKNWERNASQ